MLSTNSSSTREFAERPPPISLEDAIGYALEDDAPVYRSLSLGSCAGDDSPAGFTLPPPLKRQVRADARRPP